jgi:hypothetical protein
MQFSIPEGFSKWVDHRQFDGITFFRTTSVLSVRLSTTDGTTMLPYVINGTFGRIFIHDDWNQLHFNMKNRSYSGPPLITVTKANGDKLLKALDSALQEFKKSDHKLKVPTTQPREDIDKILM